MNTMLELTREQTHPPIAPARKGLLDRMAIWSGIALIRWARRSEQLRAQRLAEQSERAVRFLDNQRLEREREAQRAKADAYVLFRSLR
jgi:hypothetical protein